MDNAFENLKATTKVDNNFVVETRTTTKSSINQPMTGFSQKSSIETLLPMAFYTDSSLSNSVCLNSPMQQILTKQTVKSGNSFKVDQQADISVSINSRL